LPVGLAQAKRNVGPIQTFVNAIYNRQSDLVYTYIGLFQKLTSGDDDNKNAPFVVVHLPVKHKVFLQ